MEPGQNAGVPPFYALLDLLPDADGAAIQAAFRQQARRFHPDINPHPDAAARMRDINAAYATLSDPMRRADYDATHAVRRGGAVLTEMRIPNGMPTRGVGVRASGGSYAPKWGGTIGGSRPATVGVATATTHGTSFLDASAAPMVAPHAVAAQNVEAGWAARIARALDTFGPSLDRGAPTRSPVVPTASRLRSIGGVVVALLLALVGLAGGALIWGGPGILATAAGVAGGTGVQMSAPVAPIRQTTIAIRTGTSATIGQSALEIEPRAPLAPAPIAPPVSTGGAIPAPLAPLPAPQAVPVSGVTEPVPSAAKAGVPLAGVSAALENGASAPVAAGSDALPTKATTNQAPRGPVATTAAIPTPALRALNTYDQAWTAYASALHRSSGGEGSSVSTNLTTARVRFLAARANWIRQVAGASGTPEAAVQARDVIRLTDEADVLARDAATLIGGASGTATPAARALIDEASRRHARAVAIWARTLSPA